MKLSVAICTWNRASMLRRTLESIARLNITDAFDWELLVVNNNSSDATGEVLEEFQSLLPLRSLFESEQGHCAARNCALQAATGDVIVWTDDDVEPEPEWLVNYALAIEKSPNASFWGGPIRPRFLDKKPAWIDENPEICGPCFATRELGENEFSIDEKSLPYGANFAVRIEVQSEFKFDLTLGRRGSEVTGEDELDMLRRALNAGHKGYWVPGAVIHHLIPAQRMTEKYVYDYFVGQGRMLVANNKHRPRTLFSLWFEAFAQNILYRMTRPFAKSPAWMAHLCRSALARGQRLELTDSKDRLDLR